MMAVASDANKLTNRVRTFVMEERARDAGLDRLLDEVVSPAYLFGGVVRDLALYGKWGLSGEVDIDIVCGARGGSGDMFFEDLAARSGVERNRFGGLRMTTDRWRVDIWPAEETWAFRTGNARYESVESLLKTTITNWEAVLYRLNGGPLVHRPRYFEEICSGYLDVVLDDNPNQLGMYVRLVRACIAGPVSCLSGKARAVFKGGAERYSFEDLRSYERGHYRRQYIEEVEYQWITDSVLAEGAGEVQLRPRGATGRLFP